MSTTISRHSALWRLTSVARGTCRVLVTAGVTAALLAPGWVADAAPAGPDRAALPGQHHAVTPVATEPGADTGRTPITVQGFPKIPPVPTTEGGSETPHEIPVEGGRMKDWQAMLVAGGGAAALMFFFGKIRRK